MCPIFPRGRKASVENRNVSITAPATEKMAMRAFSFSDGPRSLRSRVGSTISRSLKMTTPAEPISSSSLK